MHSNIKLSIPRFKIEYKPQKLKDKLMELGMEQSFSYGADFSGIGKDLWISDVEHKAVIDVNETGTEAAAVTVIGIATTSMPNTFIADNPFMFVIADNATGTVLFMGKVADLN
jgi:serpin B